MSVLFRALPPLSHSEVAFIQLLQWRPLDQHMEERWTRVLGPVRELAASFVAKGLLDEAPLSNRLDGKYRVPELKSLLKTRGLPSGGKKADLIQRLLRSVGADEAQTFVADFGVYSISTTGLRCIEADKEQMQREQDEAERQAVDHLLAGRVSDAAAVVAKFRVQQGLQKPHKVRWDDVMPPEYLSQVSFLNCEHYDDLPLQPEHRRAVGARLALGVLLDEDAVDVGARLLIATEGMFRCDALRKYLASNPCCSGLASALDRLADEDVDPTEALARVYADTYLRKAWCASALDQLATQGACDGIALEIGDDCQVCRQRKRVYRWSEAESLPELPRHWGCECSYEPWFK